MRLEVRDQQVYITGRLHHFTNQRALEAALLDAGAQITASLNLSTTSLIVGSGWNTKIDQARARKLPILTEEQAKLLLDQGFIDLEDAPAAPALERDDNIAELRSLLAQPPSAPIWNQIIAAVDRCPAEQLDELVDYVDAQISRWQLDPQARWHPGADDTSWSFEWVSAQPRGELRCAPFAWITDMLQGHDSPKYRLIRAVCLEALGVKNADVIRLLGCAHLSNLRILDLGQHNKYSANLWSTLRDAPATRALERLRVASLKDAHIKQLDGEHHLTQLRALIVRAGTFASDIGAVERMFEASWAQPITQLTAQEHSAPLELITRRPELLPALRRIEIDGGDHLANIFAAMPDALRACEQLAWSCATIAPDEADIIELLSVELQGFELLDLSGVLAWDDGSTTSATTRLLTQQLLTHLPGSPVASAIPTIKLGRWWTPELAAALEAQGNQPLR